MYSTVGGISRESIDTVRVPTGRLRRGLINAPGDCLFRGYVGHITEAVKANKDDGTIQSARLRHYVRSCNVSRAVAPVPGGDQGCRGCADVNEQCGGGVSASEGDFLLCSTLIGSRQELAPVVSEDAFRYSAVDRMGRVSREGIDTIRASIDHVPRGRVYAPAGPLHCGYVGHIAGAIESTTTTVRTSWPTFKTSRKHQVPNYLPRLCWQFCCGTSLRRWTMRGCRC